MSKLMTTIIFDGQSSEHTVSCMSAANIIEHIDRARYNILLIGTIEEGHWIKADSLGDVKTGVWRGGTVTVLLSPDTIRKCMILTGGNKIEEVKLDVVFPVPYGLYGEDGTIQGLLEPARIPYVDCSVLASAVFMDKLHTKIIIPDLGIRQAKYEAVYRKGLPAMDQVTERIEEYFPYLAFTKPSDAGSPRGISKADNRWELVDGLIEAAYHDRKILVEKTIMGREIEYTVFEGGINVVEVSSVGEILTTAEFYDFDTKYFNKNSRTATDPELLDGTVQRVHRAAMGIFRAVDGRGLARADFFVKNGGGVVLNEINTMPGFTVINMYPMLWEARGISKDQLVGKLLSRGMGRYV